MPGKSSTPPKGKGAASGKVGKREVKAFLAGCSREELAEQILALYDDFAPVRERYQARLRRDDEPVRARYRTRIDRAFGVGRSFPDPDVRAAKQAVAEYRKVASSVEGIADVMLHYVEAGMEPLALYGLDHPSLPGSLLRMYHDALAHVAKHGLEDGFRDRSSEIVRQAQRCGLLYEFLEIHHEFFEIEPESG